MNTDKVLILLKGYLMFKDMKSKDLQEAKGYLCKSL